MPEHVLVVGPGRDFPARLRRALPGVETSVICHVDHVHKVREPAGNAWVLGARTGSSDAEWVELAGAVHARHPFTRVATFGERDQDRYAAIGAAIGLTAHSPETVALVHHKAAMRDRLAAAGLDHTASARVTSVDELREFARRHGMPCVVKPVSSAGSAGVSKVTEDDQLAPAFERAGVSYLGLANPGVLVEEFLSGPQFSVEAFGEGGEHQIVGITRKYSDPESFVELGHVTPAELGDAQREGIAGYVREVLAALGVEFGPTHTEVVLTEAGPRLIETHVRMGGDQIPVLTMEATGVDLDDCAVRQTLGEKVLPGIRATLAADRAARHSAIWFASVAGTGVLDSVRGVSGAEEVAGVTEVVVLAKPGAVVGGLQHSESRMASARALGDTAEEALTAARTAVGHLEFLVSMHGRDSATV